MCKRKIFIATKSLMDHVHLLRRKSICLNENYLNSATNKLTFLEARANSN